MSTFFDSLGITYRFHLFINLDVNGGLGEWEQWTKCDKECGNGLMHRERNCDSPLPKGMGKDCSELGKLTESKACKIKECPGVF